MPHLPSSIDSAVSGFQEEKRGLHDMIPARGYPMLPVVGVAEPVLFKP